MFCFLVVLNISLILVIAVYFLSKKSTSATVVALELVLLVSAILTFEKLPHYATLAIIIGFGLSLFYSLERTQKDLELTFFG
jgi:hypothetical protein